MSNAILTPTMITNKAVIILENQLTFSKYVDRQYSDEFAKDGAKIGATLNIRKPARYIGRNGPALSVEDQTETYIPLVVTTQFGVDVQFSSQELTLSLQDFSERVLHPNMATVANKVDRDGLLLYQTVPNLVGVPGTPPATLTAALLVNQRLQEMAAPDDGKKYLALGPAANTTMVAGNSVLFNPQSKLGTQYESGMLTNLAGLNIMLDQNVATQTVGALGGSPIVSVGQGINSGWAYNMNLTVTGWTAAIGPRLNAGDVFTIQNVFSVNPQNRQSTGALQQFVVQANVSSDGSGNSVVPIIPAIIYGGQFQNVTISPAASAPVTVVGSAATSYVQNLGFHKSAFTLATVDLVLPKGIDLAERKVYKSISLRFIRQYDINSDRFPSRSDVLYGYKTIYPELAVRLTN